MELYLLRHLAAFQEYKSLSKTAAHLFITQPALSRSMKKIEEEFGVPLFIREKNRLSLNANGEIAAEHARNILGMIDYMFSHVRSRTEEENVITIGSRSKWAALALVPLLRNEFPDSMVSTERAETEDLFQLLTEGVYQLVITTELPSGTVFTAQKFYRSTLCACVPPEHRLYGMEAATGAELNGENFLCFANALKTWHANLAKIMPDAKFFPIDEMENVKAIAQTSSMPAIVTNLALHVNGLWGNRSVIPLSDPEASRMFHVVCLAAHKDKYKGLFRALEHFQEKIENARRVKRSHEKSGR